MKIILALICTFLVLNAVSQNFSNLTIGTSGGTNLKIRFAGKQYSLQDPKVTFQSLNPGTYKLTIYQLQNKATGQDYVEVFNNDITLTAQKHLEILVLRFGKVVWDEGTIPRDDWNENYQNPLGNTQGNSKAEPIDNAQFQKIKQTLAGQYSETTRLNTFKGILKNNMMNISQIKEIVSSFYSESNKLLAAKYAYDSCTDKGSYFTLTDLFYSESNKTELMNYISSR